jgi:hypothetical protein
MPRMLDPFQFLLVAIAGWMNQRQLQVIEYLREENRRDAVWKEGRLLGPRLLIVRNRIETKPTPRLVPQFIPQFTRERAVSGGTTAP